MKFQDFKISKFQKFKKLGTHMIRKFSKFLSLIFPKIIFVQDVPIYFLIFFEVSWSLQR